MGMRVKRNREARRELEVRPERPLRMVSPEIRDLHATETRAEHAPSRHAVHVHTWLALWHRQQLREREREGVVSLRISATLASGRMARRAGLLNGFGVFVAAMLSGPN